MCLCTMDAPEAPANMLFTLTGPSLCQGFRCLLGDHACSLKVAGHGVLSHAGNLTLASTCGGHAFELSFLLVPASRQANATATQYNVQNFRSMSGSGLVELALCWTAGGSANGVAVGELFLHGPNQTVLRTIAHGGRLVVSADWWRSPASDEWVCLLKSCGQTIDDATATCAQRAVATLAGVEEDVFDLGHVAADAALLYHLCLCSNYSGRTCKDRLPVDFTVDVGEVTLLCGAAQRPQDDMCVPCGPGHYKPANLRQNDCVPCPIGRVAPAGSESCSLCSGANFSAGHVCQVCDAGRWPSDHLSGAAIGCAAE